MFDDEISVFDFSVSDVVGVASFSNKGRTELLKASSYWPFFTDQIKAKRKPPAIIKLAPTMMKIELISIFVFYNANQANVFLHEHDFYHVPDFF
jgi:dihydroorotate dehydrogenase